MSQLWENVSPFSFQGQNVPCFVFLQKKQEQWASPFYRWTGYTKITNMKLCYLDMNDEKLCKNKEIKKKFLWEWSTVIG